MDSMEMLSFRCGSFSMWGWCVRDSRSWEYEKKLTKVTKFDKAQNDTSSIQQDGFFVGFMHMALVGISHHRGTFYFVVFKDKSSGRKIFAQNRFVATLIHHIIFLYSLNSDHALATHKISSSGLTFWDQRTQFLENMSCKLCMTTKLNRTTVHHLNWRT